MYKKIAQLISVIAVMEMLSFLVFLFPSASLPIFACLAAAFLVITIVSPENGLLIIAAELIIGSKGYLFSAELGGFSLSIRIALWLIFMVVWFAKEIYATVKNKKISIAFFSSRYAIYFLILFALIAWGAINGISQDNGINNVFFDLNAWLYFLIVFPVCNIFLKNNAALTDLYRKLTAVSLAALTWICFKTFWLLYIFSHNFEFTKTVYRWIRVTGVGEITLIREGFYRIFFQSHVYALIAIFIFIFVIAFKLKNTAAGWKNFFIKKTTDQEMSLTELIFFSAISFATILISFSRSFWVGLIFGTGLISILAIWFFGRRIIGKLVMAGMIIIVFSFLSILLIVKFPWPDPLGNFNTAELLAERAGQISNEAGVSSRWSLLPQLWEGIARAPIAGEGFGASITYKSSDPRVLENDPEGMYTTYAFEWGWLDIWLKMGIFGLLIYIALIIKLFLTSLRYGRTESVSDVVVFGLAAGILILTVVSFFSPYLNHPLGISVLVLTAAFLETRGRVKI